MTHGCPGRVYRQGSLIQNTSNARVMPQKIQPSTPHSVHNSPTDSGIDPHLFVVSRCNVVNARGVNLVPIRCFEFVFPRYQARPIARL